MSEWTVVSVVATLVGLCAAVIRPLMSLNGTITRLAEIVRELEKDVSWLSEKNSQSHAKLWEAVGGCDEALNRHETRLTIIENKTGG